MTSSTARQRYLYLASRLYDLASEFSNSELEVMKSASRVDDNRAIVEAIGLLKQLHGPSTRSEPSRSTDRQAVDQSDVSAAISKRGAWNDRAFAQLLADKALFPTVSDVASVLPIEVTPRPKEARLRYVERVMRRVTLLTQEQKLQFRERLMSLISSKPTGFVSQWKSLIKDL